MFDALVFAALVVVVATLFLLITRGGAKRWLLLGFVSIVVVGLAVFQLSRSRRFQLFGHMVAAPIDTSEKVVALTFDDGPTAKYTPELLALLKRENVKATFFLIGQDLERAPDALRAISEAGHEIGNHSFTHKRMLFKPEGWIASEIQRTDALIRESGYRGPIHFRSPYGKRFVSLPWYLAKHRRYNIFFDVEPESDPETAASADAIVKDVLANSREGSIILLHPMYSTGEQSRRALPGIIAGLRARGYTFITVSDLIARRS